MTKELLLHNEIKEAFEKYAETLNKTKQRRALWKSETKEKIVSTLTLVESTFKYDWHIQRLESVENYQRIKIYCNNKSSGLVETIYDDTRKPTQTTVYTKHGGYLAFSQTYDGRINVIIGLPYIDEWNGQLNTKVISTVEPDEITEEMISGYLIDFLQTLSDWEGMVKPA